MKQLAFILPIILLACGQSSSPENSTSGAIEGIATEAHVAQDDYVQKITAYRDSINTVFADPEQSILTAQDVDHFSGLHFYKIDESYKVSAVFTPIEGEEFQMKTSTDRLPVYKPYGKANFMLNGAEHSLTLYQNVEYSKNPEHSDALFLPFTDLSSGDESYGGGRYLDLSTHDLENLVIDFNLCYNPYCAYNNRFSCPIPPAENHLVTAVRAGVKKWHD
jgi:uncharacterized protein